MHPLDCHCQMKANNYLITGHPSDPNSSGFDFILFSVKSNNTMQIQSTKYTK